jgi:hypothetical protein
MPSTAENDSPKKLTRTNAVWDLTSIPLDTPLELQLKIEIHSSESPLTLNWESSSLTRVYQLRKFISGLIPHNFRLEVNDEIMSDHAYLYEYCLVSNDVVRVFCE